MSGSQINHSFEPVLFSEMGEPPAETVAIQAAQMLLKLLKPNSLWDAWQSIWLKMSQNTGVYDPMRPQFANSYSAPVAPTVPEQKEETVLTRIEELEPSTWMKRWNNVFMVYNGL